MNETVSKSLKWVYAIVVLSAVFPFGLASSGWVAMATGRGGFGGLGLPFIGPLLFLIIGLYRVYLVAQTPSALVSFSVKGFAAFLRRIGIFAMYIGAVVAVLNIAARPLMKLFMTSRTESGAEFFVVGLYLSLLGSIGIIGLIMFELSRIIGFENKIQQQLGRKANQG